MQSTSNSASTEEYHVHFEVVDSENWGEVNPLVGDGMQNKVCHLKGYARGLVPEPSVLTTSQMSARARVYDKLGSHDTVVIDGDDLDIYSSFTRILPLFYLDAHLKSISIDTAVATATEMTKGAEDEVRENVLAPSCSSSSSIKSLPHLVAFKWHEHVAGIKGSWHNTVVTIDRCSESGQLRLKNMKKASEIGNTLSIKIYLREVTSDHVDGSDPTSQNFYVKLGTYAIGETKARSIVTAGGGECVRQESEHWHEDMECLVWDLQRNINGTNENSTLVKLATEGGDGSRGKGKWMVVYDL